MNKQMNLYIILDAIWYTETNQIGRFLVKSVIV